MPRNHEEAELSVRPWELVQTEHAPERAAYYETLFALSNGYAGLRHTIDPEGCDSVPGFFLANVYDRAIAVRTEIVNLPNWLPIRWRFDSGPPLFLDRARILEFERRLDYRRGVVTVRLLVEDDLGRRTRLGWETLLHAQMRHLGLVRGTVTPLNWSGLVEATSFIDWRCGNSYLGGHSPFIQTHHINVERTEAAGERVLVVGTTVGTNVGVAVGTRTVVTDGGTTREERERGRLGVAYVVDAREGKPIGFAKLAAFDEETAIPGSADRVIALLSDAASIPVEDLVGRHEAVWRRRWTNACAQIDGDAKMDAAIRFGIFHLLQAAETGSQITNIAARGLSSEYHSGHFFFNTEFFKLPYFAYSDPSVARGMIRHRVSALGAAERHAKETGFAGARYPEEIDRDGEPAPPWEIRDLRDGSVYYEWSGREKYFLSAAVAYGIAVYLDATADEAALDTATIDTIIESARFAASLFTPGQDQRYVIRQVMGPDEYHYHVDNSYFTNWIMAWLLRFAADVVEERHDPREGVSTAPGSVPASELASWREIADHVYLPEARDGVLPEFEGYFDLVDQTIEERNRNARPVLNGADATRATRLEPFATQLVKEADIVLLLSLFPSAFENETARRCLEYYGARTMQESSLSAGPYALTAARLGEEAAALRYLNLAVGYDLDFEPREAYRNGLHLATYAAAWNVLVFGFLGVRSAGDSLSIEPRVPQAWSRLRVTVSWRGAVLDISATNSSIDVTARIVGPEPPTLVIAGTRRVLETPGAAFRVPLEPAGAEPRVTS